MRAAIVIVAILLAGSASAQSPDISARRLLSSWKIQDPMMSKIAEMIAAAFSGGRSWRGSLAGKEIYCPPPGLNGHEVMIAFENFLADHPEVADKPYGDAHDAKYIANALGTIARARGTTRVAQETELTRQALCRSLSKTGDPRLTTLLGVAKSLGLKLTFKAA